MLETLLLNAAQRGQLSRLKLLIKQLQFLSLDYQNSLGQTALLLAAAAGHSDCVRLLLERGASVDVADSLGQSPLLLASRNNHLAAVTVLLDFQAKVSLEILHCLQTANYSEVEKLRQRYLWSRRKGFLCLYAHVKRLRLV